MTVAPLYKKYEGVEATGVKRTFGLWDSGHTVGQLLLYMELRLYMELLLYMQLLLYMELHYFYIWFVGSGHTVGQCASIHGTASICGTTSNVELYCFYFLNYCYICNYSAFAFGTVCACLYIFYIHASVYAHGSLQMEKRACITFQDKCYTEKQLAYTQRHVTIGMYTETQ